MSMYLILFGFGALVGIGVMAAGVVMEVRAHAQKQKTPRR